MNQKDIYYSEDLEIRGKSGFPWKYDFIITRSKNKPERLCETLSNPNKSNINNILFGWMDTLPKRKADSKFIVFLNDEKPIPERNLQALRNYDTEIILWSQREDEANLDLLTA